MTGPENIPVEIRDNNDGTYAVALKKVPDSNFPPKRSRKYPPERPLQAPTLTGQYRVEALLDRAAISGSPLSVTVQPKTMADLNELDDLLNKMAGPPPLPRSALKPSSSKVFLTLHFTIYCNSMKWF